ncbi:MAG TPA: haloacid dehalogenase type II [Blastocatellia bacterium]|nr:haloacid dehalogenase type II [Blastocatellia bacterium]
MVKALTFDVFGTVVDTRQSIIDELTQFGNQKHINENWARFADKWMRGYASGVLNVNGADWVTVDEINRYNLDELLTEFNIEGLTEYEKLHVNEIWHRLKPWPDSPDGIARLRQGGFKVATLTNGNISLLKELSKNMGITWDDTLSAEMVKRYKPDKMVYEMAVERLNLQPGQIMMVAAHRYDLDAAQSVGFKTAFVMRPDEWGPGGPHEEPGPSYDIIADGIGDLAKKLGLIGT